MLLWGFFATGLQTQGLGYRGTKLVGLFQRLQPDKEETIGKRVRVALRQSLRGHYRQVGLADAARTDKTEDATLGVVGQLTDQSFTFLIPTDQ